MVDNIVDLKNGARAEVFSIGNNLNLISVSAGGTVLLYPHTHQASEDPDKWNKEWDKVLQQLDTPTVFNKAKGEHKMNFPGRELESILWENQDLVGSLHSLRYGTRALPSNLAVYKDFFKHWASASPEWRRVHALHALSEACSFAKNLNNARAYCLDGELSVENLSNDPSRLWFFYEQLLNFPERRSSQETREVCYFSSKKWDAFRKTFVNPSKLDKAVLERILLLRAKLIHYFAEWVIVSCNGKKEFPKPHIIKERGIGKPIKVTHVVKKFAEDLASQGLSAAEVERGRQWMEEEINACKNREAEHVDRCSRDCCKNIQSGGVRFRRCGRCRDNLDRIVLYCSRECQVADWKSHKAVCGKSVAALQ